MITKNQLLEIMQDTLLIIRKTSQETTNLGEHLHNIYILADIMHNVPSLLYKWEILEQNEPEKLEFLTNCFVLEAQTYIESSGQYSDLFKKHLSK